MESTVCYGVFPLSWSRLSNYCCTVTWAPAAVSPAVVLYHHRWLLASSARALQPAQYAMQELGLPEKPDAPMLGFIGRLDYQKGVDLIRDNFWWIMDEGCQLVLLGTGRDDLENSLRCARAAPGCAQMLSVVVHRYSAADCRIL